MFAADEIQLDLKINSVRFPLPFTPGDEFFFQETKNTLAEEMCISLHKERAIHLLAFTSVRSLERSLLPLSPSHPPQLRVPQSALQGAQNGG